MQKIKTAISIIYLFTSLGLFSSCFVLNPSKQLVFDPIPCDKFIDCKETIKKVYMVQKSKLAPVQISVTDEYITWSKDVAVQNYMSGATTTHLFNNTIYFRDIERLRVIDDDSGRTEIRFINKANKSEHTIFLYDKDYAIQGYSAIKCLIELNKTNSNGKY